MFNFKDLITKYSTSPIYLLNKAEGFYDYGQGGIFIDGKITEVGIMGAIVPLSNEDLRFDEGGTYDFEDKKIYCYLEIAKGEKIKHKGKIYTVLEKRDYSDFDVGLFIYFLKRG